MKFGRQMRLMAVPGWLPFHVDYDALKAACEPRPAAASAGSGASAAGAADAGAGSGAGSGAGAGAHDDDDEVNEPAAGGAGAGGAGGAGRPPLSRDAFLATLAGELARAEAFYESQLKELAAAVGAATAAVAAAVDGGGGADAAAAGAAAAGAVAAGAPAAASPAAPAPGGAAPAAARVREASAARVREASAAVLSASELLDDLRRFASLNVQAVEKLAKKWSKHRAGDAGVGGAVGAALAASPLSVAARLHDASDALTALVQRLPPPETRPAAPPPRRPALSARGSGDGPPPDAPELAEVDVASFAPASINLFRVRLGTDALGAAISVPIMLAKGGHAGPVLGLTSALHGNELNGIPLIHRLFRALAPGGAVDVANLAGVVLAVPVVNTLGYVANARGYADGADLNRLMPGKKGGTASQQFCAAFMAKVVEPVDVLIDLHTASFGRVNSLYVRADMNDARCSRLAKLQSPQIVVHNSGPDGSLRGACAALGKTAITVEIGNPQLFQEAFIERALGGVLSAMSALRMIPAAEAPAGREPAVCARSMWLFTRTGGLLHVLPELAAWVRKGEVVAEIVNVFGELEDRVVAPVDGIIVGKATNPVVKTGDRVLHLGVVEAAFAAVAEDGHA